MESGANALVAATGEFLLAATGCSIDLQSGTLLPRSAYVAVPDEPAVTLAISTLDQGAELILVRDYTSSLDSNSIRIEFREDRTCDHDVRESRSAPTAGTRQAWS